MGVGSYLKPTLLLDFFIGGQMEPKGINNDIQYWLAIVNEYIKQRNTRELYQPGSRIAPSLIVLFYNLFPVPCFDLGLESFRNKYIKNETEIEQVSNNDEYTAIEQKGMRAMYDHIEQYKFESGGEELTLFELKTLHRLLYSFTSYPEYAGMFRNAQARFSMGIVDTCLPHQISYEFYDLDKEFNHIIKLPHNTGNDLINYIDECVKLTTKLLKIHPFNDGNGRSIRGLLNLMFKKANIPPVYVVPKEKAIYNDALIKAQIDNEYHQSDYTDIIMFYYYKICDSLIEIDSQLKNNYEIDDDGVRIYKMIPSKLI